MVKVKSLVGLVLAGASVYLLACADRLDLPYRLLTGYSRTELEQLSFLSHGELEARLGLREVPGGLTGEKAFQGRGAHAIASYLGTRRWGPDVTLAVGYLKEYLPAAVGRDEADPRDIAANYAGVTYALRERERGRR